jgi:hypothetical protein
MEFNNFLSQLPIKTQHILIDMHGSLDLTPAETLGQSQNPLFVFLVYMKKVAHIYLRTPFIFGGKSTARMGYMQGRGDFFCMGTARGTGEYCESTVRVALTYG